MSMVQSMFSRVVDASGRVDYSAVGTQELSATLDEIATADLVKMDRQEQYAFLLNAYNAWSLALAHRLCWRDGRMRSLRNPWIWIRFFLLTRVRVAGKTTNLARLEHSKMKPFLRRDPRGHFALVCASTGCPPLKDGIYHGESLDQELDMAAGAFLRPGVGYRLDRENNTVTVNRILKWYRRDFASMGGALGVLERHAPEDDGKWIAEHQPKVRYMKYDWGLNASGG